VACNGSVGLVQGSAAAPNTRAAVRNSTAYYCTYNFAYLAMNVDFEACESIGGTNDIYQSLWSRFRGCVFGANTEHSGPTTAWLPNWRLCLSVDHDGAADAIKGWTKGGVITSVATPLAPAQTFSYQLALASAANPVWIEADYNVEPGAELQVTAYLQKDAAMTYLPRAQIIDPFEDPLIFSGASALYEAQMTDSLNEWETFQLVWVNTAGRRKTVKFRCLGKDATGNVYCQWHGPETDWIASAPGSLAWSATAPPSTPWT
jgi:hypothetical protein